MFAGHLGVGLMLKRPARNLGLPTLWIGAMFLDALLWFLVLLGIESVRVPANYHRATDLVFDFPFSHSLVASLLWSGSAMTLAVRQKPGERRKVCLVLGAAVFSHFILDWLTHLPELPLAGRNSPKLGLGLWKHLSLAWGIEAALLAVGIWVYLKSAPTSLLKRSAFIGLMTLVMAMTVAGQASHTPPPSAPIMAATSLGMIVLLCLFAWWMERKGPADRANQLSVTSEHLKPNP